MKPKRREMVDHPDHYKSGGMEAIDAIDAFGLGFSLGDAVKYILRCGRKDDRVQELDKACWYIQHQIELIKEGKA